MIHDEQELAATANRKGFDDTNPWLLDRGACDIEGRCVLARHATNHFVLAPHGVRRGIGWN